MRRAYYSIKDYLRLKAKWLRREIRHSGRKTEASQEQRLRESEGQLRSSVPQVGWFEVRAGAGAGANRIKLVFRYHDLSSILSGKDNFVFGCP